MVEQVQANYTLALDRATLTPAEQAAATGDVSALREEIKQGMPIAEARRLVRSAGKSEMFQQVSGMNAKDALRVWATIDPKEQDILRPLMVQKLKNLQKQVTQAEFNSLAAQYRIAGVFK